MGMEAPWILWGGLRPGGSFVFLATVTSRGHKFPFDMGQMLGKQLSDPLSQFILTLTLDTGDHPHFTDEETEGPRGLCFPRMFG